MKYHNLVVLLKTLEDLEIRLHKENIYIYISKKHLHPCSKTYGNINMLSTKAELKI